MPEPTNPDFTQIDLIAAEAIAAGLPLPMICDLFERRVIAVALSRSEGNVTMAARSLGIHRNSIYQKLRKK